MMIMINTPESMADSKLYYIRRCINDTINNQQFVIYIRNIFKAININNLIPFLWKYQNNFRFVFEVDGEDYCKDGLEFLTSKFGDCDDFTVFNAAILQMYGIKYRIKVTDTFNQGYYTHIMVQYYDSVQNRWISIDGTYRLEGLGGEPKYYKERYYY